MDDRAYLNTTNISANTVNNTLPMLFTDCVQKYPSNIALKFDDTTFTYQSINTTVNQFANFLLAVNIKPEARIAVALDRSPKMLIALLAILKAGAAHLPLDPEYPKDRLEFMINDADTRFLITSKKYGERYETNAKQLFIEDIWPVLSNFRSTEPEVSIAPDSLAYILYTSGSTGRPKGVPIEHRSLSNLLLSMQKEPGITSSDVFLSVTTISFDIAALELFLPLIAGATLIITNTDATKDSRHLLKVAQTQNVSIMQATPNTWRMMLESGWAEKLPLKALCGGEALTKTLADKLVEKCASLWNMYGPTETTIWSTIKQISPTDLVITIGKPIDNTVVYILDEQNIEVAPGSQGEICIGGDGLARGYLNKPELTAEKFFIYKAASGDDIKLYRTGDLGQFLPGGDIQCFGRIDHQVKIRGYRIELGEIESVIQSSGLVSETVVMARPTDDGNDNLIAYAIPSLENLESRKQELYDKQVKNWETVYDVEYEHSETMLQTQANPQFDTNIWKDSFTIKIIPTDQMQEWLADIIEVILAQKPKNLLEIGSGTGLIYYKLAPHLKKYIGTDFSRSGINAIGKQISIEPEKYPETNLMVCAAHEIHLPKTEEIDTIVINSVIQYFPGEDYLLDVLAKSIQLLNGDGRIVIGDVRDVRLLTLFKQHLFLTKVPPNTEKAEFEYIVDQEVLKEEELCVSPDFFYNLKNLFPEITHVDIQWKQGNYVNELIAYRYAVVIHIGNKPTLIKPQWVDWDSLTDKTSIKQQLQNKLQLLAFEGLYNPRLATEMLLKQGLDNPLINTTADLITLVGQENTNSNQVSLFIKDAQAAGYRCRYYLNQDPLKLNLVLTLPGDDSVIESHYGDDSGHKKLTFTNNPLLSAISGLIQQDIYKLLLDKLPSFMVPANFILLSKFPLTNNGKIDRQFLMRRSSVHRFQPSNYREARTDIERKLVSLWRELLGVDRISIDDNFFELGGNSLIAIRIMITLEKETGQDLPLSSLFEYPTIEQLAAIMQAPAATVTTKASASKCLVRLKPEGSKTPLYIVHGWGLTVFIFKDLAKSLHPDQPVFALQGIGVDGTEEPLSKVEDIAARYISEILEQNPTGPYAFAGYSLGGVIACEIVKQLRIMGKQVTMLAMFDAYAHTSDKNITGNLLAFSYKKFSRFFLRIGHNLVQLIKDPNTWNEKMIQINRKLPFWMKRSNVGKLRKDNDVDFYSNDLSKVYFSAAVQNYKLTANEDTIELFRGTKNIYYYMDDPIYLEWDKYAKTVNLHRVKGSHTTMFLPPNDKPFAQMLQQCLDKANGNNL